MTFNRLLIVSHFLPSRLLFASAALGLQRLPMPSAICLLPFAINRISSWHVALPLAFCHQSTPAAGLVPVALARNACLLPFAINTYQQLALYPLLLPLPFAIDPAAGLLPLPCNLRLPFAICLQLTRAACLVPAYIVPLRHGLIQALGPKSLNPKPFLPLYVAA